MELWRRNIPVLVDPTFGPDFSTSLYETIQNRVASPMQVLDCADNDGLDTTFLKVEKHSGDAKIFGPENLIGYRESVRGLPRSGTDIRQSVSDVATALTHLARFKQILELRHEASQDQPPFSVLLHPKGLPPGTVHVQDDQEFRFQFKIQSQDELYITVINLGPGFHIKQLFPGQDSPEKLHPGLQRSFSIRMEIPEQLRIEGAVVSGITHREIIRIVVTKGGELSWKSLDMPVIWHANPIEFKGETSPGRCASLVSELEWWIQDVEIWINPT
ncbi:hypothetical protein QQS21_002485 [Conoideocrella luteorostrata]|uniref:Uncharacterized protein n=1 Tax=Conoideocrella luteorostrata TaxID=1105319 RepID=A0AAJ0G181_9HYPO|nr:hypothetical protein QQS21_002485 [Conoideocrella luteorostrata]